MITCEITQADCWIKWPPKNQGKCGARDLAHPSNNQTVCHFASDYADKHKLGLIRHSDYGITFTDKKSHAKADYYSGVWQGEKLPKPEEESKPANPLSYYNQPNAVTTSEITPTQENSMTIEQLLSRNSFLYVSNGMSSAKKIDQLIQGITKLSPDKYQAAAIVFDENTHAEAAKAPTFGGRICDLVKAGVTPLFALFKPAPIDLSPRQVIIIQGIERMLMSGELDIKARDNLCTLLEEQVQGKHNNFTIIASLDEKSPFATPECLQYLNQLFPSPNFKAV